MRLAKRVITTEPLSYLEVSREAQSVPDAIYLNIGEPDFPTPAHIIKAAAEAMSKGLTHYTQDSGIPELRAAIAEKENRKTGLDLDEESVVVTTGATGATYAACMTVLEPGDEVLVPEPYYSGYYFSCQMAGGSLVGVKQIEEEGFQLDLEDLKEKVTNRTKAMIVASPNNPTGAILDESLNGIADLAVDEDLLVISDEVYDAFVFDSNFRSIASLPGMSERTIIANSLSKTYAMTGWRVGYAAGPPCIIQELSKSSHATGICVNSIAQYAALAALTGPQECVKEMVETYRQRRETAVQALAQSERLSFVKPKGAFYIFPNISSTGMNSQQLFRYLLKEARVVTLPGYPYFGPRGEGHIRISYSVETDRLSKAVSRIVEALAML